VVESAATVGATGWTRVWNRSRGVTMAMEATLKYVTPRLLRAKRDCHAIKAAPHPSTAEQRGIETSSPHVAHPRTHTRIVEPHVSRLYRVDDSQQRDRARQRR
jgi:hypothetical protein